MAKVSDTLLTKVDLLTPNSTEASQLNAMQAADILHRKGVRQLIITLGTQGALLSDGKRFLLIPVYPAHPKDSTGAGDSFNGALAARLAAGEPLEKSALFASAYASVCVERAGAAHSMPLYAEAVERMQAFPAVTIQAVGPQTAY